MFVPSIFLCLYYTQSMSLEFNLWRKKNFQPFFLSKGTRKRLGLERNQISEELRHELFMPPKICRCCVYASLIKRISLHEIRHRSMKKPARDVQFLRRIISPMFVSISQTAQKLQLPDMYRSHYLVSRLSSSSALIKFFHLHLSMFDERKFS